MTLEYKIDSPDPIKKGTTELKNRLNSNIRDALNDVGMSVRKRVRDPIRRHPGADSLYNQIELVRATATSHEVSVETSSPKAVYRELDMPAHMIYARPKTGGRAVLAFTKRGKLIFTPRVKHPGSRGTHSWQHGSTAMRMRLNWAIPAALDAAIQLQKYAKRYS
jgi:hypothetical protein